MRRVTALVVGLALLAGCARVSDDSARRADGRLPERWRGFNLLEMFVWPTDDPTPAYREWDFKKIREWGFNFVRLPIDYRYFTHGGDWNVLDEARLQVVDRAIELGEKYDIHVQVCLHRAPGYCVNPTGTEPADLFADATAQTVFARDWGTFARRWRRWPNRRVSFDLVNEPPKIPEAKYVAAIRPALAAIRAEDPDRLVFSDGRDGGNEPTFALAGERGVAQAMRGYKPMSVSHFGAPWCAGLTTSLPPVWPLATDAPEGILAGPGKPTLRAPLVVEDVPAGRLALHFGGVSEKVTVRVTGDGETLADVTLRPETNSPRWRSVAVHPKWKILQGDYVGVETVRVARAVKRLEIGLVAGDWCHLTGVRLTANDGRTALLRITPRFAPARRFARRFVGFDAAQPFAVADGTSADARSDGASASAGADWLEANVFAPWDRLAARGVPVMMGEFGAFRRCPHAVARVWLEDNLRLLKRRGWSWALWNFRGTFGVLDSNREDVTYEDCDGHKLDRALLDLLQRY